MADVDIDLYDTIEDEFPPEENTAPAANGNDLYDDVITTKASKMETDDKPASAAAPPPLMDVQPGQPLSGQAVVNAVAGQIPRRFSVYVANLTWWTNDQDVIAACNAIGIIDVLDVKFYENRANGQSRGFATVSFSSQESFHKVMENLKNTTIHGQTPTVHTYTKFNLAMLETASGGTRFAEQYEQAQQQQQQQPRFQPPMGPRPMGGPRPYMQPQMGPRPGMGGPMRPGMGPPGQQGPPGMGPRPPMQGQPGQMAAALPGQRPGMPPQMMQQQPRPPMQQQSFPPGHPGAAAMPQPGMQQPGMLPNGMPQQQPQPQMQAQQALQPQMQSPGPQPGQPMQQGQPAPHVNPAFFQGGQQPGVMLQPGQPVMVDQFGRPIEAQPQPVPVSEPTPPKLSDEEFQDILTRNKSVSSSAISRAVQDASQGDFAAAIETLVTAISLIKQSKIASDERCKILIASLQDTKQGIEDKSYGSSRSRDRDRSYTPERRRSRSPRDREYSRKRERSRSRDRDRRDYRERSRERESSRSYYDRRERSERSDRDRYH